MLFCSLQSFGSKSGKQEHSPCSYKNNAEMIDCFDISFYSVQGLLSQTMFRGKKVSEVRKDPIAEKTSRWIRELTSDQLQLSTVAVHLSPFVFELHSL